MMNWVGHVYIHIGQELLGASAKSLFSASAAFYGLLLIGLIYLYIRVSRSAWWGRAAAVRPPWPGL
jgi:hypothetical protein